MIVSNINTSIVRGIYIYIYIYYNLKGVGLKEQKLAKFDNVSFFACKIISFQNDNAIFVSRQEITFFGAQKGLWGGRRGSDFLIF